MKRMFVFPCFVAALVAAGCSGTQDSPPPNVTTPTPPEAAATTSAPTNNVDRSKVTAWEGSWKGEEQTDDGEKPCTLVVTGNFLEFHGADPNEWIKGTFELNESANPKQCIATATDAATQDSVGKKSSSIYNTISSL